MSTPYDAAGWRCPVWCALRHGDYTGEEDLVHISEATFLGNTSVRLCMTMDHETGKQDGPYVLLGGDEYSLHEAAALVDVLRVLLDLGHIPIPRAGS